MGKRLGGRQKGTPNKSKEVLVDKAKSLGVDPFEVLLLFAKGDHERLGYKEQIEPGVRSKCACEASQYLYAKRKAIEVATSEAGIKVNHSLDQELKSELLEALKCR